MQRGVSDHGPTILTRLFKKELDDKSISNTFHLQVSSSSLAVAALSKPPEKTSEQVQDVTSMSESLLT